jgi:hypothetical protein
VSTERFVPCFPRSTSGSSSGLATARGLGDAPVHRQVPQLEADHLVVGVKAGLFKGGEDFRGDPLVGSASDGGGRACGVGDLLVGSPEDEDLHELVEHHPVRDAWPVATQRMLVRHSRDQHLELVADGFDDARWNGRHECSWSTQ